MSGLTDYKLVLLGTITCYGSAILSCCPSLQQLHLDDLYTLCSAPFALQSAVPSALAAMSSLSSLSLHAIDCNSDLSCLTALSELSELSIHELLDYSLPNLHQDDKLAMQSSCHKLQVLQLGSRRECFGISALTTLTSLGLRYMREGASRQPAAPALHHMLASLCHLFELHLKLSIARLYTASQWLLGNFVPVHPHLTCLTVSGTFASLPAVRYIAHLPKIIAFGLQTWERSTPLAMERMRNFGHGGAALTVDAIDTQIMGQLNV